MTDRVDEQRRLSKQVMEKKVARERHESKVFAGKLREILALPESGKSAERMPMLKHPTLASKTKEKDNGDERKPLPRKPKEAARKPQAKSPRVKDAQNSEVFLRLAAHMPPPEHTPATTPSAQHLSTLSSEAINEIIENIERSISLAGHQSVTIDLRESVLSGARIHMSVQDRKLRLLFARTDGKTRALLRNARRDFERRLQEKNLTLSDFLVH